MKRAFVALLLSAVAFATVAKAQDKFTWDPKKKRAPKVGMRFFASEEQNQKAKVKIVMPGQEPQNQNQSSKMSAKQVHEILAVEGDKVTKEKITFEKWSAAGEGADEDKSLEGKTITVETGADKKRTYKVEGGDEGLSEAAKQYLEKSFTKPVKDDEEEKLFPKEPIAEGAEWTIDPKSFAEEALEGTDIDMAASSAKGKLTSVKVEDGVHVGKFEITLKLKLKTVPNAPVAWTEGGIFEMNVTGEGSLEPEKAKKMTLKMDGRLKGKTEQETEAGKAEIKMDIQLQGTQEEGDLPAAK